MNAQEAIEHALEDLVKNEKQFTNYDVTKHARSFTDDNVKHQDVIAHVSVEMDENDYYYVDVVQAPKGSGSVGAVLYSPTTKFVYEYSPDSIQTDKSLTKKKVGLIGSISSAAAAAQAAASQAAATVRKFQGAGGSSIPSSAFTSSTCCGGSTTCGTPSSGSVASKSTTREVIIDNRGRVCIPKSYIDRIGKGAGDVVYVQKSSVKGKVVISAIKWSAASCTALTTNQVDCYGNVRITPKSLDKCNVSKTTKNGSEYVTVRSESDHIVIE